MIRRQEDLADATQHVGATREPADGVEAARQRHDAVAIDRIVRRPDAEDAVQGGRNPHRAAGVAAQRKIDHAVANRRGRAAGRAAGNPVGRHRVARRTIVEVLTVEAEGEFIGDGLAQHIRAGVEQRLHHGRMARGRLMGGEPIGIAAASHPAGDVEDVLHRKGQALQRAARGAGDSKIAVRTEGAGRKRCRPQGHIASV